MRNRKGTPLKTAVKVCISIILIIVLFSKVGMSGLMESLKDISPFIIFFAVLLNIISVIEGALKWKKFLNKVSLKKLVITCFEAQFFAVILPGQLFGEMSKVAVLHSENVEDSEITASVIADKVTGLFTSMAIGVVGIVFSEIKISVGIRRAFFILLIVFMFCFYAPFISFVDKIIEFCISKGEFQKNFFIKNIATECRMFYETWKMYVKDWKKAMLNVLWGFGIQFTGVIQIWGIVKSLNVDISIVEFMWIIPAVSILLLLPVSFGGLGLREISIVGFLGLFGISNNNAVLVSLLILLGQIMSALVGGAFLFLGSLQKPVNKTLLKNTITDGSRD